MTAHLRLITPSHENRSVPTRPANAELRQREYLTEAEVEKLMKAAKDGPLMPSPSNISMQLHRPHMHSGRFRHSGGPAC
jgi:hypothetical protein